MSKNSTENPVDEINDSEKNPDVEKSAAEITKKRTFDDNKDESSIILMLDQVYPDPDQPRKAIEEIEKKMVSLRKYGQFEAITVRYHPEKENCFMIVDGERRWTSLTRLAKEDPVKFSTIRATLRDDEAVRNPADRATIQHTSNTHKEEMKPYEEYKSLKKMMVLYGFTKQSEIAEHVGESPAKISKLFKFDKLTENELKQVEDGILSATTIKNHGLEAAKIDAEKIINIEAGETGEVRETGETEKVKKPRVSRISISHDVATNLAFILQKISENKGLSPIHLGEPDKNGKHPKKEIVAILEARSAEIADLL